MDDSCDVGECKEINSEKYRCFCPLGYREANGTCVDVDECANKRRPVCGPGSSCSNSAGSFSCTCRKSYYWDGVSCARKGQLKECSKEFPKFLIKPEPSVEINLGEELRLTCIGTGVPAPNVYWTKGPNRMRLGPTSVSSSIFFLPNVTKKDVDLYECVLEDCCSGRVARAKVDVSVPSEPCTNLALQMFGMVWQQKTWDDALKFCLDKGLTLGMISTNEDRKIMREDAWKSYLSDPNGKKFANEYWLWIGVNDREEEGVYKTVNGGTVEAGTAKWLPGVPDNWINFSPEGQDVIAVHRLNAYWDDSYDFHLRPFACQCADKST